MNKRDDIQHMRARAIFAVLAFHIWPKKFPFGYLGVDIFFVISGYLMTSILAKSSDQSILTFYSRRIKRIFPLCLVVIAVSLLIGYFTLLPSHYAFLQIEAIWASLFVNNFAPMFSEGEYFELVSGFQFFLHTWSLGVEVQFYLIAPFLIKFLLARSHRFIWIAVIGALSASAQLIIPSEAISFGLVFCRIWQFMIGTAAFCAPVNESFEYSVLPQDEGDDINKVIIETSDCKKLETDSEKYFSTTKVFRQIFLKLILLSLTVLCFIPNLSTSYPIIPPAFRLLTTILTGLSIAFNGQHADSKPKIINEIFVYIGDASYAIYLIHWPLIIFFKYFYIFEEYGSFFTLVVIIFLSIIVHEVIEKPLGKHPWKTNLISLGICYGIIVYLIVFGLTHFSNSNSKDPVKLNEEEAATCLKFYYPNCTLDPMIEKYLTIRPKKNSFDNYCSYKFPNNNSSKTIMVLGNSFVYFQIRGIYDAIQQAKTEFNKIYVSSHTGCSLMVGALNQHEKSSHCQNFDGSHDALLKAVKPDIIIQSSRLDHFKELQSFPQRNYSDDEAFKIILASTMNLASYTKKLIIIQPTPHFTTQGYKNPLTSANLVMNNKNLSQFDMTKSVYNETMNPSWYRVVEASKHCHNCVLIPTEKLFCNDQVCPMIDPITKLGRYCDNAHITPTESLKFIPSLIKAIDG